MAEPFHPHNLRRSSEVARRHGLIAHGAGYGRTAMVTHAAAAKATAAVARCAAAGHAGAHIAIDALLRTTIAASTLGGVTFLGVFNNLLDDLDDKRRGRLVTTRYEQQAVLDSADRNAQRELGQRGSLTRADDKGWAKPILPLAASPASAG